MASMISVFEMNIFVLNISRVKLPKVPLRMVRQNIARKRGVCANMRKKTKLRWSNSVQLHSEKTGRDSPDWLVIVDDGEWTTESGRRRVADRSG